MSDKTYNCRTLSKIYDSATGEIGWETTNDNLLYDLANQLMESGWDVRYRYHIAKVRTTTDILFFNGVGDENFAQVRPQVGSTKNHLLVINQLPAGYSPSPGFQIHAVTGTTDKTICHPFIVEAIVALGVEAGGEILNFGPDLDDPEPNTILCYQEFPGMDTPIQLINRPLHRKYKPNPGNTITAIIELSSPAVGLHTSVEQLHGGGYACYNKANNPPDATMANQTGMFIFRNGTGGIEPFHPTVWFAPSIPTEIDLPRMHVGIDKTTDTVLQFTRSKFVFATNPFACYMQQISDGFNGHLTCAALDLPLAHDNDITAATISIAGSGGGGTLRFRDGPAENTLAGTLHISFNGHSVFNPTGQTHLPRFMTLFAQSNAGQSWENGLGQITEAWTAFQPTFSIAAAPVLGRLPGVLVVNKGFDATAGVLDTKVDFDGSTYKVLTHNATLNFGIRGLGSIWLKDTTGL